MNILSGLNLKYIALITSLLLTVGLLIYVFAPFLRLKLTERRLGKSLKALPASEGEKEGLEGNQELDAEDIENCLNIWYQIFCKCGIACGFEFKYDAQILEKNTKSRRVDQNRRAYNLVETDHMNREEESNSIGPSIVLRIELLKAGALLAYEEFLVLAHNVNVAIKAGLPIKDSIRHLTISDNPGFAAAGKYNTIDKLIAEDKRKIKERVESASKDEFIIVKEFEVRSKYIKENLPNFGAKKTLYSMLDAEYSLVTESMNNLYYGDGVQTTTMSFAIELIFTNPEKVLGDKVGPHTEEVLAGVNEESSVTHGAASKSLAGPAEDKRHN